MSTISTRPDAGKTQKCRRCDTAAETGNIECVVHRGAGRQRREMNALLDLLDECVDRWHDEHLCEVIGHLMYIARWCRPIDRSDPWSVLLHSMFPGAERPGEVVLPVIGLVIDERYRGDRHGQIRQLPARRYQIEMGPDGKRSERRATLAHALAHIQLGVFNYDKYGPRGHMCDMHDDEELVSLSAEVLYDADIAQLVPPVEAAA